MYNLRARRLWGTLGTGKKKRRENKGLGFPPPSPHLHPPPREHVCTGQATNAFLLLVLYIAIGWRENELRILCPVSSIIVKPQGGLPAGN